MTKEIHLWGDGSSVNKGEEKGLGGYGYTLLFGDFKDVDIATEYGSSKMMLTGWEGFENTTNQREEIKAIIYGLKRIKNNDYPIQVFSDSAYVINCMKKRWYSEWIMNDWIISEKDPITKEIIGQKPVDNRDLWEELLEVIDEGFFQLTFNKVKGHSGIFYNEQCDKLAGQGLAKMRELKRREIL